MKSSINKDDFQRVLNDNKKIIFKVCNTYCKEPEDRKDLTQEIVYQIWKSFANYNSEFKYSTWIYRIALNVAISFYRKSIRISANTTYPGDDMEKISSGVESNEETESNISLLHEFIDGLDELNKALMILYLDDKSYKEMSEILGISETNVATKISRIKIKLKEQFENIKK